MASNQQGAKQNHESIINESRDSLNINTVRDNLEEVDDFIYLRSNITSDGQN